MKLILPDPFRWRRPARRREQVVFFFDDSFSSFNVVLKNLHAAFASLYADTFDITHDAPANLPEHHDSTAYTVTYTHYWAPYMHATRQRPDRDFRLYAVNYEHRVGAGTTLDHWSRHILEEEFEVVATSTYCRDFIASTGADPKRISVLPHGYWPEFGVAEPDPEVHRPMTFLAIVNSNDPHRYNADITIEAFEQAFGPRGTPSGVRLVLKDYGADGDYLHRLIARFRPSVPIEIVTGFLTNSSFVALYGAADIFVAPFRGEGFGMKILEAGVAGLPIVCPAYSGPLDYLDQVAHVPVPFGLEPVHDTIDQRALVLDDGYLDCRIEVHALAEALLTAHRHADQLKRDAASRAHELRRRYSWEAVASQLRDRMR